MTIRSFLSTEKQLKEYGSVNELYDKEEECEELAELFEGGEILRTVPP